MEITVAIFLFLAVFLIFSSIRIVSQSEVLIVERLGKYNRTLKAGLSFIMPITESIKHKISILERQLPIFTLSVITKDNVEVELKASIFFRIINASQSVYRIKNVSSAIEIAATSVIRSATGKLELDELQSSRQAMNTEISQALQEAATLWGVEITRTEVVDVIVDEKTKESQRQQLNAERQKRAAIATSEGEKKINRAGG